MYKKYTVNGITLVRSVVSHQTSELSKLHFVWILFRNE